MKSSNTSKEMQRRKLKSVKFEDYIRPDVRRKFPLYLGWNIDQERAVRDGTRPDYVLYRVKYGKKERAVIEAKDVAVLTKAHVEQLDHYCRIYHATYRLLYIPQRTFVDSVVREYAYDLGIQIVRTYF